jgi:hypothetical protein
MYHPAKRNKIFLVGPENAFPVVVTLAKLAIDSEFEIKIDRMFWLMYAHWVARLTPCEARDKHRIARDLDVLAHPGERRF